MLTDADMPEVFRAADAGSVSAQTRFLRATRVQLVALALGATLATVVWRRAGSSTDLAAVAAAVAFGVAAVLRAATARSKPERTWYDGRAVAESAKTLAWRYAAGGAPFGVDLPDREADAALVTRLLELPAHMAELQITPTTEQGRQITPAMRSLRKSSLEERKQAYAKGRVQDQQAWYANKARWNRRQAERWNRFLLTVEVVATIGAAVKATMGADINLLPAAGAITAGAAAWLQTKQHENLARAYTVTSLELASIGELLPGIGNEREWAHFIDQAEEAISREHTMWKASRS
jgi:conflict system pore-forming effector with SLATT domain